MSYEPALPRGGARRHFCCLPPACLLPCARTCLYRCMYAAIWGGTKYTYRPGAGEALRPARRCVGACGELGPGEEDIRLPMGTPLPSRYGLHGLQSGGAVDENRGTLRDGWG